MDKGGQLLKRELEKICKTLFLFALLASLIRIRN
jgi:hypothetical protein